MSIVFMDDEYNFAKMHEFSSYVFLNMDPESFYDQELYTKVKKEAVRSLRRNVLRIIIEHRGFLEALSFVENGSPKYIEKSEWKSIEGEIIEVSAKVVMLEIITGREINLQQLQKDKELSRDVYEQLVEFKDKARLIKAISESFKYEGLDASCTVFETPKVKDIYDDVSYAINVFGVLRKHSQVIAFSQELASKEWLKVEHAEEINSFVKKYKEIYDFKRLIEMLVAGNVRHPVDEHRFENLEKKTILMLNKWIVEMLTKEKALSESQNEINEEKMHYARLRDEYEIKVRNLSNKLNLIDRVLTNPDAIDRVENEINPFSKGNFENLQKVAVLLKKAIQTSSSS